MRTFIEFEAARHIAVCGHRGKGALRSAEVWIVAQIELYLFFLQKHTVYVEIKKEILKFFLFKNF
jgi:carbonic anhydrase